MAERTFCSQEPHPFPVEKVDDGTLLDVISASTVVPMHQVGAVTPEGPRPGLHQAALSVGAHTLHVEMTDEGTLDLGNIEEVRANLDKMHSMMIEADRRHRSGQLHFTERLMDEQKPAGKRAYILAHQLIGTAVENWDAVFSLLQGAAGATPVAPFNLIRPAFEAAFHALWILDAHDPATRCLRGLRMAHEDNKQKENWWLEIQKLPFLTAEQRKEGRDSISRASTAYRQDAMALDIQWPKVTQRIDTPRELGQLSFVTSDSSGVVGPTVLATWRQLSGYQHGLMYAILRGSTQGVAIDIPGGSHVRLTVDDTALSLALQVAALMQMWAIGTYLRRCERPSTPSGI